MLDIEKLQNEMASASAQKASEELDKMIKLHEDAAKLQREVVKKYLLDLGTTPGKIADYAIGGLIESQGVAPATFHSEKAKFLKELKAELEK